MVAMNAQTYARDMAEVKAGGWLIYDSTWPRAQLLDRDDITVIGIPFSRLCNENFDGARSRILMKNIAYVGAVAALLNIDVDVIKKLLEETFAAKAHMIESNMKAIQLGFDEAQETISCPLPMSVEAMDETSNSIIMDGNTAAGLGCMYAGATVGAWYPITPSTSLMDAFRDFCLRYRIDPESGKRTYCIIQAEDELAAIGMVIGAAWNGARSFRTRRYRHGDWCRVERSAFLYTDQRAGYFIDERIHRLRVLRRDTNRNFQRAAHGSLNRYANPDAAMRHY